MGNNTIHGIILHYIYIHEFGKCESGTHQKRIQSTEDKKFRFLYLCHETTDI